MVGDQEALRFQVQQLLHWKINYDMSHYVRNLPMYIFIQTINVQQYCSRSVKRISKNVDVFAVAFLLDWQKFDHIIYK
jgi:hypothetical protein